MKSKALDNFQKRLESFSKLKNINQTLADKIAERGVELAKENYSGYERVSVDKQETEKPGKMQIIAKGKGLAFVEFGTGKTGEGTYPDKDMLPKDTIEFENGNKDCIYVGYWKVYSKKEEKLQIFERYNKLLII